MRGIVYVPSAVASRIVGWADMVVVLIDGQT